MSTRLDAMMKQYEDSTSSKNGSSKKFDLKNYFATFLPDGVKSGTKRVRIIEPNSETETGFAIIHGHKAQVDGKWRTFVCAKHEKNQKCPFCEAREILLATGEESDKKEAIKFSAKKMYVVKVIDRDKPEEGVKFWRFNHDYRNTGTFNKIMDAFQLLNKDEDPLDSKEGRDLIIKINRDTNNRPVISSINLSMDKCPLSEDETQANEWLADERTWEDVYSVKSYEYLEIIVRGGIPVWQKDSTEKDSTEKDSTEKGGKWVDKASISSEEKEEQGEELDSELSMGVAKANEAKTAKTEAKTATETSKEDSTEDDDDNLPF